MNRSFSLLTALALTICGVGCGDDEGNSNGVTPTPTAPSSVEEPSSDPVTPPPTTPSARPRLADDLPNALLLAYSQFQVENGQVSAEPGAARLEIIRRTAGEWQTEVILDPESNVFHKAMPFALPGQAPGILTIGANGAHVKLWRRGESGWSGESLWSEEFGGRHNRMRDAEIADLNGDQLLDVAVVTHDQGIVAVLMAQADGSMNVERLDQTPNTFVHEVEIGDLDGDGTPELYTTPSEPNSLEGGEQHGQVLRYVAGNAESRTVVADLGNRHAKEILVADVDGDGRDELYVVVEALTDTGNPMTGTVTEPVEIRRYEAQTSPTEGAVIARIPGERLTRFLTVGDADGDGDKEMIVSTFGQGVWLLEPGRDANGEWSSENIDRDSGGFEHAAYFTDLDGDGSEELYIADDNAGELHRYIWHADRPRRSLVTQRDRPRERMVWNITSIPVSALSPAAE